MMLVWIRCLLMGLLIIMPYVDSLSQGKRKSKKEYFYDKKTIEKYKYTSAHHVQDMDLPRIETKKAKNIILLIGDGMGSSQIYAGMVANKGKLYLEYFPSVGFIKTHSANDLITDSAAGATAFATGNKTNNGMIGVTPDNQPMVTILEMAEEKGLSTGLVATSTITHATPACFISHEFSRHYYEQIAADFVRNGIDVFIGGGRSHFSNRLDRLNLLDILKENNYTLIDTLIDLDVIHGDKIAGLLWYNSPPSIMDGRGDMLPLASTKAINVLSKNSNGFFLMVEGSQIDWGNHQNNILYQTEEMLDFDKVIGRILEFAATDRETLVIVTSDHETGGLAISGGNIKKGIVHADYTTNGHTADLIPVFAYGPSAELFQGIFDNTEIFHKMIKAFDWDGSEQ